VSDKRFQFEVPYYNSLTTTQCTISRKYICAKKQHDPFSHFDRTWLVIHKHRICNAQICMAKHNISILLTP